MSARKLLKLSMAFLGKNMLSANQCNYLEVLKNVYASGTTYGSLVFITSSL